MKNKKYIKKIIFRVFFGLEVLIFSFTYLFGTNGIYKLNQLKRENHNLKTENLKIKNEINEIENQIKEWSADPFYIEKVAREQLQMARKDDQIYILD